jgi:hypothetical protein
MKIFVIKFYADEFCSDALPGTPAAAVVAVPEFSALKNKSGLLNELVFDTIIK